MATTPTVSIAKAISILRSAIVNARIYPRGSQMVESTIKNAHQMLEGCLEETPQILISDVQGKLCINGKEASDARDFRPFLVQHETQSLKVLKGVTVDEIVALVDALGKRKGQLEGHKNLGDWLKAQNVTHITAEEIQFVAIQKGEVVVQQVTQLLEQSTGDIPSLISSLEESFKLIDQIPEEQARKDVHKKMAEQLSGLPPYQLRELFESKLPPQVEQVGLKDNIIQSMTKEKLEETLEEVNKWYHQIKQESKSEFEVVERISSLKSFLGKVLQSPVSKMCSFGLYEELLNVGLLEDVPPGVQKGENASLMAQVEHLLSQPSASLLDPGIRQGLPDLLKSLCGMGLDEPLQKLTEKIIENLHNPAPLVRQTAVKTLRLFMETAAANRKEKTFSFIVSEFHKLVEAESAPDVYGDTAQALQVAAMELLVNWRFEESAVLLAVLRRHSREESPIGEKKKQYASRALRDFSTRGLDVICADLNASLKDRQNGAYRVLAEIGADAVPPLIETLKRSVDSRVRQTAVQALKRLGSAGREPLIQQITPHLPGDVLVKLIPLLEDFIDVSLLSTLTPLLQHPEASVRRQVALLLAKMENPAAHALLLSLLGDPEGELQIEVVRLLSELKVPATVNEICQRLLLMPSPVQEEMCIALGNLMDKKAIPSLCQLYQNKGTFWKKIKPTSDLVRLRAVWALGKLLPDAEAEKILTKALKDANSSVQRAAQQALQKPAGQ